jgi:hypothetical protein
MTETLFMEYGKVMSVGFFSSTDNAMAIDPRSLTQSDFWTSDWQARHEEAVADLQEGRFTVYETGQDFLAAMDEAIARNEARNSR